jgi:hypothetical protein
MCDYSLYSVKSRAAKVGDRLTTRDFGTRTRGFSAPEDLNVAVCVLPGTELSFADEVRRSMARSSSPRPVPRSVRKRSRGNGRNCAVQQIELSAEQEASDGR